LIGAGEGLSRRLLLAFAPRFPWSSLGLLLRPWRGCDAYRRLATAHVVNESHIVRPDAFLPLSRVKNAPKTLARFMLAAKK
jgi:hypothetical protein